MSETPSLKKMPLGIGGLTSLQTLSKVYIEESSGFKISELKGLYDLQGQLSIYGLDKVVKPTQAKDANLQQKKGLDCLLMMWSHIFDDSRNPMIEYEVLESLRPYPKLRKLNIIFYGGMKFPSWVGDPSFNQLTELTLHGCRKCSHLPTLGHLSLLRKLVVRRMDEVKTVGFELVAPTNYYQGIAFPSLEVLKFYDMQSWEIWSTIDVDNDRTAKSFPHLRKIYLQSCPKLAEVSIGLMPSLQHLFIDDCSEAVLRAIVGVSPSVVKFKIRDIKGLTQIQGDIFHHLGAVEHKRIRSCGELRYLWGLESGAYKFPVSLPKLEVYDCKNLVSLRKKEANVGINMESFREVIIHYCEALESYNCPNSVEMLDIQGCSSMTSLTFSTLKELSSSKEILAFHRLKYHRILKCENLKSFPHEHLQILTSLKGLVIRDCPCIDYSFPCGLWPPNLMGLGIGCLNKPMSEWGLQNYPMSLVNLNLNGKNSGVVSFAVEEEVSNTNSSFLLPMSLRSLSIYDFMNLESLSEVLPRLTRLEELRISSCPNLRDLSDTTSYPSSLKVKVSPSKTHHSCNGLLIPWKLIQCTCKQRV